MSLNDASKSLAEKLGISATDLRRRKALLGIHAAEEAELYRLLPAAEHVVGDVIETFYKRQLEVPEIVALIGDKDTLNHLKRALHDYVLELFSGEYGLDYAARRIRVGRVHGRIGIPSKYYVAALFQLFEVLREKLEPHISSDLALSALHRLLLLDLELTFDTYVHGLLCQVAAKNEELEKYSRELEGIVSERTAQLEEQSRIDQLTGLNNRRAMNEALERECAAAERRNGMLCVAFVDLDGFKAINDSEGHEAGDQYLRMVARTLRQHCRASDSAFRYGGDEFCLLLPETDEPGAATFTKRLGEAIGAVSKGRLSASIGWAISEPSRRLDARDLLRRADQAMFAVKRGDAGHDDVLQTFPRRSIPASA